MKIIAIIIILLVLATHTKSYREVKILMDIRKNLNRTDNFQGLTMNNIHHYATALLVNNKITYEFYEKIFIVDKNAPTKDYWVANREIIEKLLKKAE